jgi:hypothetical protein
VTARVNTRRCLNALSSVKDGPPDLSPPRGLVGCVVPTDEVVLAVIRNQPLSY